MQGSRTPPPPADTAAAERKHVPPSWAGEPSSEFSLEVIKDGVSILTLPISERDHYIVGECPGPPARPCAHAHHFTIDIGRQPDVCEILLDHPSISRQHAAFQFNKNGASGGRPPCPPRQM